MITLDNYEEYFLLYIDDELPADQKKAVDDFVLLHPDLKDELDLLCSTKLPAEAISFSNKEELLADSMKVNAVDESLLLYIDNELPETEKRTVEARLKNDATFTLQHQLLLKTKLDKTEHIPYPNKKELYRRTERRIAPVWLRVAAAVVLLASGAAVWMNMDFSKSTTPNVAVVTPKKTVQQSTTPAPNVKQVEAPAVTTAANTVAATKENPIFKKETSIALNTPAAVKHAAKKVQTETFSKPHVDATPAIAAANSNNLQVAKKEEAVALQPEVTKKINKPVLSNPVVTSDITPAYIPIDATAKTTVPVNAVALENDTEKSGGSVKGFLRKATRIIERRTGIKTVNDNDELLIGAVALKL